jgi:uncharacterized membrane protein (UPF0127 family)
MRFEQAATLHTRQGAHALRIHTARGLWSRFRGLMLTRALNTSPQPEGLFIPRCPSVHGFFMRYALDIVYLGQTEGSHTAHSPHRYLVTHTAHLKPWRVSIGQSWHRIGQNGSEYLPSQHALELPPGSIQAWRIAPGDRLEVLQ